MSIFTAPLKGKYLFSLGGYSPTAGSGSERYALGIGINGALYSFVGGAFSAVDSPLSGGSFLVYLEKGNTVNVQSYTAIPAVLGSGWTHHVFFQGVYLGP